MIGMKKLKKLAEFFKSQTVLCIALICAVLSSLIVHPDKEYAEYMNWSTLILLFCLMAAVAGFRKCGIFNRMSSAIISRCGSIRKLIFVMMNICFFSSMLITNDVALISFVPVTIMIFEQSKVQNSRSMITAIIIETAAANLGSMLLPTGNPQNIYICSNYNLSATTVITTLLPYGAAAYILLSLSILLIPDAELGQVNAIGKAVDRTIPYKTAIPSVLIFIVSLFTVSGAVNEYVCLSISLVLIFIADKKLFFDVDYLLLLTFVCFFVFSGNIGRIEAVMDFFSRTVDGREMAVSITASQVISNVPAAVLLSEFTDKAQLLLIGTNIGGLGTPVASLASLISYKLYSSSKKAECGRYMMIFIIYNAAFLAVICCFSAIIS